MHFVLVKANMKSKKEVRIDTHFLLQRFMLSEMKSQKNVIGYNTILKPMANASVTIIINKVQTVQKELFHYGICTPFY